MLIIDGVIIQNHSEIAGDAHRVVTIAVMKREAALKKCVRHRQNDILHGCLDCLDVFCYECSRIGCGEPSEKDANETIEMA
jgi:hypothetical protein